MTIDEKALDLHEKLHGKLSTEAKCHVNSREDLSLAYTPGVAEPLFPTIKTNSPFSMCKDTLLTAGWPFA